MNPAHREKTPRAARQALRTNPIGAGLPAGKIGSVAPSANPPREHGGSSYSDEFKVVLDVMRSLADQEFDRAERLSVKARQAFAFVSVLLAGVQAAALTSLTQTGVSQGEQTTILYLAGASVALAAATGVCALVADGLRSFQNLSSQDVLDSASDALATGQPVAMDLAELYATVVDERRDAVARRRRWLLATQIVSILTILSLAAELLYTLHTRLP